MVFTDTSMALDGSKKLWGGACFHRKLRIKTTKALLNLYSAHSGFVLLFMSGRSTLHPSAWRAQDGASGA